MNEEIIKRISQELKITEEQIQNTLSMLEEGNTVPFIARYRKEQTKGLDEEQILYIQKQYDYQLKLAERKEAVLKLIGDQGKLTDEIKKSVEEATKLSQVEDIYRPYAQKKKTRATTAIKLGLQPLSEWMLKSDENSNLEEEASKYITEEVKTTKSAIQGAKDIIAEMVSDNAKQRWAFKDTILKSGVLATKIKKDAKDENKVYEMYYDRSEKISQLADHRIMAIDRAEKEKVITVSFVFDEEYLEEEAYKNLMHGNATSIEKELKDACVDGCTRLLFPSIEREIRNTLTENAQERAISVFGKNVKSLLLQAPVKDKVVMGFDPAFRTGCKIAVVDKNGKLLDTTTVYPTEPQNKVEESKKELKALIEKYNIDIIAIGNGTASRESEKFVSDMIKEIDREVQYIIVSEAGASVYSASELANEEHPDINVSLRGAISIARRLQDPLAELVKIDPKSIGVGQYQHDLNQKKLEGVLDGVVEDSVNSVGVDLNTASYSLLEHIAGISKTIAKNIVAYREENGDFTSRAQIKKVKRLGPQAFTQCAGFMRIEGAKNPLDNTGVHPESYDICKNMLDMLGYSLSDVENKNISDIDSKVEAIGIKELSDKLQVGEVTLKDIIAEIKKPGRDPREEGIKPILRTDVLKIEDITEGMILKGTVRNVVDFGAFVDIGIKNDGLVHKSEMSKGFVKDPMTVVTVGDIVDVKVIGVDMNKKRVALSMKM